MKELTKNLGILLPFDLHQKVKVKLAQKGLTFNKLIKDFLTKWLEGGE